MRRNVEVKARVDDLAALRARVEASADTGPECLDQEDVFFLCRQGRLKLRKLSPERGELIFYRRSETAGPKDSVYEVSPTWSPGLLEEILTQAYGVRGIVRKERTVFWVGQTRIHLDRVEGLGDFLELEVVLRPGQSFEEGSRKAYRLLDRLEVSRGNLIAGAYLELLEAELHGEAQGR